MRSLVGSCALALALVACSASVPADDDLTAADELSAAMPGIDTTALDRTVDPCTDFYAFACGGYAASLPADTTRDTRSFTKLRTERLQLLSTTVAELLANPKTPAETKAGAYYNSCMAEVSADAFVGALRTEIETATTPSEIARLLGRLARLNVSAFFSFRPSPDWSKSGRVGAAMMGAGGYQPWGMDYESEADRTTRANTLSAAIVKLEPATDPAAALSRAQLTVEMERKITAYALPFKPTHASRPVGRRGLELAAPDFDWNAYFTALGRTSFGDFPVSELDVLPDLAKMLAEASAADLRTYLVVRLYERLARMVPPAADRAPFCQNMLANQMVDAIETRYLEAAGVTAAGRAKARAMYRAIVATFDEELEAESFLDVPTRIEAQLKLDKMRGAIGASRSLDDYADANIDAGASFLANNASLAERAFDDALAHIGRNLPLLDVEWSPATVNASYNGMSNTISVPGGILGGYFFSPSAQMFSNYAGIGSVLGHEITHGFDNNGRRSDANGAMRDWWTPEVAAAYETKAKCLVDQYSAFELPGVVHPVTGQTPAHVDGELTLGENIADNNGVKIAFHASKVASRTAPIVEGFTPAQQFFIGYAQLWCSKTSPEAAAQLLVSDPHSPPEARVNLPLTNFETFATTFQCATGSKMAPANRCTVW
jgi:predicted metalloendopeptidase